MDRIPKPLLQPDEVLVANPSAWLSRAREIGTSRQGRAILAFEAGDGDPLVTLIGGCHADEPVGPALLDRFASHLISIPPEHELLSRYRWRVVPHVNPDGEERNRAWTGSEVVLRDHRGAADRGYDLGTYLRTVVRELPGEDIEFGFPGPGIVPTTVRPENRAVADFLAPAGTPGRHGIRLHGSFHGMSFAPGPWFLLERSWIDRTATLRRNLAERVGVMGYRLFDAERRGEKGFHRIDPGFATRPDSIAMREYFEARDEPEIAERFRPSSMEFARRHGDDPLTLVTEMPLFLTPSLPPGKVERPALEALRARLAEALSRGPAELQATAAELGVVGMPVRDQMRLQLAVLNESLQAIGTS